MEMTACLRGIVKGKGRETFAAFYKNKYASDKCARVKYSRNYGIKMKLAAKVLQWEISLSIFLNSLPAQRHEGAPKQKLNASRRATFVITGKYLLQDSLFQVADLMGHGETAECRAILVLILTSY